MAKKDGKNKKEKGESRWKINEETRNSVLGIFFLVLAVVFLLAGLRKAGIAGESLYSFLSYLLGFGYFLIPTLFVLLGISFFRSVHHELPGFKTLGGLLFFLSGLAMLDLISANSAGIIGHGITTPLVSLFDIYASFVILFACVIISILILFDLTLGAHLIPFSSLFSSLRDTADRLKSKKEREPRIIGADADSEDNPEESRGDEVGDEPEESPNEETEEVEPKIAAPEIASAATGSVSHFRPLGKPYTQPPVSLLERDKGKPGVGDIKANANIIKRTLQNFGISVEMDEISIGPSVTRYALKPAEGVKLSRIVALQNDLSLALAAHPIRIEAPIPGKSLVGVEIPNAVKSTVGLANLIGSEEFQNSDKPLFISLGRGISGKSHFGNLAKMPHALVAGATGSGKSVTIHAIITSLLYRNSPENMRFIMIDPKRVELTLYNKIPHLLTPVITDAKKAILALKWAAKEMDRRYDILESESVRDIESYHKNILRPALEKLEQSSNREEDEKKMPEMMPYIIIIIDELADIMQTYPRELEAAIVRLAQMSRAVGIHLILSTQRPSVNVITGLIKANVPARIALQVASQIDSRTILDGAGAEKLLGAGDMLYLSGDMAQPTRIQSAFISESEVKKVVKYLADSWGDEVPHEINFEGAGVAAGALAGVSLEDEEEDPKYEEARQVVIEAGKASTSLLQRRLGLGYARAARLMDILEERGIIGPADGAKPREVFGVSAPSEEEPAQ
jgi:S-DNA-T family DNA segregation ATPase FtsK/SpoIIIE